MLPMIESRPAEDRDSVAPPDVERDTPTGGKSVPGMQLQPYGLGDLARIDHLGDLENNPAARVSAEGDNDRLSKTPNFLEWAAFEEATLRPRKNVRRSRLDKILSPLKSVSAGLPGNVSVEGLGGIIESAHGIFHSVRRHDFMESERTIHLMRQDGGPAPSELHRRELERYENELFDLSKYNGSCDYLTAMAWTEESLSGSITLYRVLFGDAGETIGIRPVAAMRDVPSPVLVRMRIDERLKRKAVLTLVDADDRTFDWRANPSAGPRYVRLRRTEPSPPHLRSPSRSRSQHRGAGLADGHGVRATIPQFFAMLHARRSFLEHVKSSRITPTWTEDGEVRPAVLFSEPPRSSPHEGDAVHVAVLVPNDAAWAEEEIIWTDETGLAEFRQRQYWDLIERARRPGGRSRSRGRGDDHGGYDSCRHRSRSQGRGRSGSRSRK